MSARRQARARGLNAGGGRPAFPRLLASRTDPGWADPARIIADLGDLMRPADDFRMSIHPRALYSVLLGRWAAANGYSRDGHPDWRELRAAGLIDKETPA